MSEPKWLVLPDNHPITRVFGHRFEVNGASLVIVTMVTYTLLPWLPWILVYSAVSFDVMLIFLRYCIKNRLVSSLPHRCRCYKYQTNIHDTHTHTL
jgi:hypothetical protein